MLGPKISTTSEKWHGNICNICRFLQLYSKTAHGFNLLEVGVVLVVILVKLLEPARCCAREGWTTTG